MSGRPGFLSPTGIVVAVVLVAVVIAVTLVASPFLFSPGSLNSQAKAVTLSGVTNHAQLGNNCGACHTAPWSAQTMADKCLACHTDVTTQISGKTGVHGHLFGPRQAATCGGCHPDHRGATGALTSFDENSFPHGLTGFSLSGHARTAQGRRFTCHDCHANGYGTTFDQTVCATCHAAINATFMSQHKSAFGSDCLPCHNGSGTTVDHSKFPFKLTGKHAGLPCTACHGGAKSIQDFQKAPTDCYSCHAKNDKHNGSFGQQCGTCHSTSAWTGASFSHTIFPVNHGSDQQQASCQTCHPNGTNTYTCFGCHAHTQSGIQSGHEGRSLAQLTDCIKCHPGGRAAD